MNKWYGKIGFAQTEETRPGVWTNKIIEKNLYGDMLNPLRHWSASDNVNDDLTINIRLSVVADSFVMDNLYTIKYVELDGVLWKVTSIEPQRPRIILSLGGLWNGETPETT